MNPGSWNNQERTGPRRLSRLSPVFRQVTGVRHINIDWVQFCASCQGIELLAEEKHCTAPSYAWRVTKELAERVGARGALIIDHDQFVNAYIGDGAVTTRHLRLTDDDLVGWLTRIHDEHRCSGNPCPPELLISERDT